MRTKALELYGTLGPACAREDILEGMFRAGMTGMRVNLSHMTLDQARPWIEIMHRAAARCGLEPDLLADLQGPEVRVGKLPAPLALETGETVALDALLLPLPLREMLAPGQEILLDDGKLLLETLDRDRAKILRGGTLLPRKSAAVPGLTLTLPPLTPEDEENLRRAEELGVTGVMQSFVRGREDVLALRSALCRCGCKGIRLYAKVENRLGLETLPQWIDLADCIVIARGDLGNAIPLTRLPAAQKAIAGLAKERGKPFLVVTQLLASMERSAVPTRAEVSDIYNAVLDGASALMLTGETAGGAFPREAMEVLCRTAQGAWNDREHKGETNYGLY